MVTPMLPHGVGYDVLAHLIDSLIENGINALVAALKAMTAEGKYPDGLWK